MSILATFMDIYVNVPDVSFYYAPLNWYKYPYADEIGSYCNAAIGAPYSPYQLVQLADITAPPAANIYVLWLGVYGTIDISYIQIGSYFADQISMDGYAVYNIDINAMGYNYLEVGLEVSAPFYNKISVYDGAYNTIIQEQITSGWYVTGAYGTFKVEPDATSIHFSQW